MKSALFVSVVLAGALCAQTPAPAKAKAKPTAAKAKAAAPAAAATPSAKPAPAADGKVVLTVGDVKITDKQFDAFVASLPPQYQQQAKADKRGMAEQIVRMKLLVGEAKKRGLDKDASLQQRIALSADNLMAGAAFNDILDKTVVDDAATRKYYETNKNQYENVTASHILIKFKGSPVPAREGKPELSEEEALAKTQEIRKKLLAGGDFAAIAKEESDDTGSGANGGSLGTFTRGQMVPAFEQAAFALPVGQISEPVKSQFGYHLIKVEKHESKAYDEVKKDIEQKLKPETARDAVEQLRKNASVVLDDAYFGPEKPAPPAAPAAAPAK